LDSNSAEWFAAIEEIVGVCGEEEVSVEDKHCDRWPKG